jgi:hypothetical protein
MQSLNQELKSCPNNLNPTTMKRLLSILLVFVFLFSCKKSDISSVDQKTNVTFSVTDFTQAKLADNATISDNGTALGKKFAKLTYFILDASGRKVLHSEWGITSNNFQFIQENLPAGDYTAVFIGHSSALSGTGFFSQQVGYLSIYPSNVGDEIYYKKLNFSVGDESLKHKIELDRIVAALEVNLLDETIPDGISKVEISYYDKQILHIDGTFHFGPNRSIVKEFAFKSLGKRDRFQKYFAYVTDTTNPVYISISYTPSPGERPIVKSINVNFYQNKKSVISGKLFSGTNYPFQLTLSSWESPTVKL